MKITDMRFLMKKKKNLNENVKMFLVKYSWARTMKYSTCMIRPYNRTYEGFCHMPRNLYDAENAHKVIDTWAKSSYP